MNALDLLRFAWAALKGHRLRTAMTLLGMAIGVGAVILLTALGEGAAIKEAAASAIDRHDWLALVALAAAASRRSFADMALALTSAEAAALPALLNKT